MIRRDVLLGRDLDLGCRGLRASDRAEESRLRGSFGGQIKMTLGALGVSETAITSVFASLIWSLNLPNRPKSGAATVALWGFIFVLRFSPPILGSYGGRGGSQGSLGPLKRTP